MTEPTTVLLDEATADQMRAFAATHLGMEFPGNTKPETIRARIKAAHEGDTIPVEVDDGPEPLQTETPAAPQEQPAKPGARRYARILIQTDEDDDNPVQLGVNGRVMLVPRGEEAEIPEEYLEVLEHAVTFRYRALKDGGIDPTPQRVPLYPYQVIRPLQPRAAA